MASITGAQLSSGLTSHASEFLKPLPESAPQPTISKIDFAASGIPQYANAYAIVIDDLFTRSECAELVNLASKANNNIWDRALVNVGGNQQAYYPKIRNCGRIIFDTQEIADKIWHRVKPYTPGLLRIQVPAGKTKAGLSKPASVRLATGLNERLRFLKYGPGEFFEKHCDGCFRREISNGSGGGGEEFSLFTLHLYLNDDDADGDTDGKGLVGGATSFFSPWNRAQSEVVKEVKVKPKIGRVLIFQQADLLHSGEEVIEGLKLTMRTDIMYTTSV